MGSVGKRSLPKCRLRIFRGPCGGRGSGFLSRGISLAVILALVFAPLRDAGVAVLLCQRFSGVSLSGSVAGKVVGRGDFRSWFSLIQLLFSPLYADSGDVLSAGATEPMQDTLDSGKVSGDTIASPVAGQEIEKDSASLQSDTLSSSKELNAETMDTSNALIQSPQVKDGVVIISGSPSLEEGLQMLLNSNVKQGLVNAYEAAFNGNWEKAVAEQIDSLYTMAEHDRGGVLLLKKYLEDISVSEDTMRIIIDGVYKTPNPDYYAWILLTGIALQGGVFTLPHEISLDKNRDIKLVIDQSPDELGFDVVFTSPGFSGRAKQFEKILKEELEKRGIYPYMLVDGERYSIGASVAALVGALLGLKDKNSDMDFNKLLHIKWVISNVHNLLGHLFYNKKTASINPMFWALYPKETIRGMAQFILYVKETQRKLKEAFIAALKRWKAQQEQNNFADLDHFTYQLQTTFVEAETGKQVPGMLWVSYARVSPQKVVIRVKLNNDRGHFTFDVALPEGAQEVKNIWFVRAYLKKLTQHVNFLVIETDRGYLLVSIGLFDRGKDKSLHYREVIVLLGDQIKCSSLFGGE